jgi:hypothetical protein
MLEQLGIDIPEQKVIDRIEKKLDKIFFEFSKEYGRKRQFTMEQIEQPY